MFSQVTFQKALGGTWEEFAESVQQTTDGGYIITGYWNEFRMYLVKTDINGDTLWTKIYEGTKSDNGTSVQQTIDGGYIIAGSTGSFGAGSSDVYLIKTDVMGNTLWLKTFGGSSYEGANSIQQTTDGGYIFTGLTASFGAGKSDVYLVKTNSSGIPIWTKTFGGTDDDQGYSVRQTNDGGYIISGTTSSFGAGYHDVYLIKTDIAGNIMWNKTFGGGVGNEFGYSVEQTVDGGFAVVGSTNSFSSSDDILLLKTDSNGNSLWTKTFGGTSDDDGSYFQQTNGGGFVIVGTTFSFGSGMNDVCLFKTDSGGNTLWSKTYGGSDDDGGWCVTKTSDGGFVLGGYTDSFGSGVKDFYFIKTDSIGNSGCNETNPNLTVASPSIIITSPATQVSSGGVVGNPITQTVSAGAVTPLCSTAGVHYLQNEKIEINIFPNPSNGKVNVQMSGYENVLMHVQVYNVLGVCIYQQTRTSENPQIDLSSQPKGIYFYRVTTEKGVGAGKIVIQ